MLRPHSLDLLSVEFPVEVEADIKKDPEAVHPVLGFWN